MAFSTSSKWLTIAVAAVSAYTTITLYLLRRKCGDLKSKVRKLEVQLESATEKCAAERQGRIKAQQTLRKALAQPKSDVEMSSYPMMPIGTVQSCFATRNGTPRQPLIVPLARACLVFDPARVPPASLEGLEEYSHCWILYVFHLNTDLDKLWKKPSQSKFKAKVRVPRLKGGRMGVFATRSPHRPCPIGLTVAKVEAVKGNTILLSGADLVDGTPVLDIKPYLPYSDSVQGAMVPKWVMGDNLLTVASVSFGDSFESTLADCWRQNEKKSLYASSDEIKSLIRQVLSWDIRSVSQRQRPHDSLVTNEDERDLTSNTSDLDDHEADKTSIGEKSQLLSVYHLMLEGLDICYRIDSESNVIVEKATLSGNCKQNRCNYIMWKDTLQ